MDTQPASQLCLVGPYLTCRQISPNVCVKYAALRLKNKKLILKKKINRDRQNC